MHILHLVIQELEIWIYHTSHTWVIITPHIWVKVGLIKRIKFSFFFKIFKNMVGWSWLVPIERTHIHSDKRNATNLQSMNFQMCWSNLILSFPKVWWQGHNCFEISYVSLQVDYSILGKKAFQQEWRLHLKNVVYLEI
jgi:hypothetical protein